MTKKLICSLVAACALSATATAAFLLTPGQALAQNDGTTVDQGDSTQDADDAGSTGYKRDHEERIKEALQGLVDDGTLTTPQVDAVVEALAEARPDGRRGSHAAHAWSRHGADIANILGVTEDELKTALADGETIADVATEQGVVVQEVIDAIVAATTEKVNAAVEAGRIDQERANEILDNAAARATDFVNGDQERPTGEHGRGERGRVGRHGSRR